MDTGIAMITLLAIVLTFTILIVVSKRKGKKERKE